MGIDAREGEMVYAGFDGAYWMNINVAIKLLEREPSTPHGEFLLAWLRECLAFAEESRPSRDVEEW